MKKSLLVFILASVAMGQPKPSPVPANEKTGSERDLQANEWKQVYEIIDEIKEQNIPRKVRTTFRGGFTQITQNTDDAVNLGFALSTAGVDLVADIYKGFGVELNFLYSRNIIPSDCSLNKSDATDYWLDIGPRYTLNFDATRINDYLAAKILYHRNVSNFKIPALISTDTYEKCDGSPEGQTLSKPPVFVTDTTGISLGVERGIQITKKLGIVALFYLIQTTGTTTKSKVELKPTGYGFQFLGEVYYQIGLFQENSRLGVGYIQQGSENEIVNQSDKALLQKNSYFQLARTVQMSFSMLF